MGSFILWYIWNMKKIIRAFEYTNRDGQAVRFSVSERNDNPESTAMTIMYLMMKDDRLPEGEAGEWIDTILSGRSVYSPETTKRSEMSTSNWDAIVDYANYVNGNFLITENVIFNKVDAVEILYATCQSLRVLIFEWDGRGKLLDVLEQDTIDTIDVWEPYVDKKDVKFLINVG